MKYFQKIQSNMIYYALIVYINDICINTYHQPKEETPMIYILIVIAIVLTDTMIKNYIEENTKLGERKEILKGKIIIRKHYNRGMMLDFMEGKMDIIKKVSGVFLGILLIMFFLFLPKKGKKVLKLGLSFVIGGAISNVADRFNKGYVVDYFSFNTKFEKLNRIVFNLSDMFIFLGSIIIAISGCLPVGEEKLVEEAVKEILDK